MRLAVRQILGLGQIPNDRSAAQAWLKRHAVPIEQAKGKGGRVDTIRLSDLPSDVHQAVLEREALKAGVEPGLYDEEAHAALVSATPAIRAEAGRKAEVALFMLARRNAGLARAEVHAAVWATFGREGNSPASLDRYERQTKGVDPVNFAPVLADGYCGGRPRTEISPEAWAMFEGLLKGAFKTHRLVASYNDVGRVAKVKGWRWPSYSTVLNRFRALPVAEQRALREGRDAAQKTLYQSTLRDMSTLGAMELVSLDGRVADVWVRYADGSVIRPTIIGLVDVGSGKVLDFVIAQSENAEATARLLRNTAARYGGWHHLQTNNGRAFSGHKIAGQVQHKNRNKGNRRRELEPPGLHIHYGFKMHFARVANGQAKLMERKFADMSREIDTCPEFSGAHAGSRPGERPDEARVPIAVADFEQVYRRRVDEYNARNGRRSQACLATGTSSYNDAFAALSVGRKRIHLTEAQLRLAMPEWTLSTVNREGRVRGKDGWVYGEDMDDGSQDTLLKFEGKRVWVATNPLDRGDFAMVWNPETGKVIANRVLAVKRGAYMDAEGARRSGRARAHVRLLTKRIGKVNEQAAVAELLALEASEPSNLKPSTDAVVQGHFKGALRKGQTGGKGSAEIVSRDEKVKEREKINEYLRRAEASGERLA